MKKPRVGSRQNADMLFLTDRLAHRTQPIINDYEPEPVDLDEVIRYSIPEARTRRHEPCL